MDFVPAIILIVIATIAGYVIGIVDSRITSSLRKKTEEKPGPAEEASPPLPKRPGEHTVLSVSMDDAMKWHLELDGSEIAIPESISQDQRQRIINVIVQMRPWLDGKPTPPPVAPPVTPAVTHQPVPVIAPIPHAASVPVPTGKAPAAPNPLKLDPMRGFRSLLNRDVKTPSEQKGISIVAMIDEVLQTRLSESPLANMDIKLEEGPLGEVNVCVGTSRYQDVDSVPDTAIRELIKSAIADWEKR
jgi:hypothetical protein